jgi:hypothetical protein
MDCMSHGLTHMGFEISRNFWNLVWAHMKRPNISTPAPPPERSWDVQELRLTAHVHLAEGIEPGRPETPPETATSPQIPEAAAFDSPSFGLRRPRRHDQRARREVLVRQDLSALFLSRRSAASFWSPAGARRWPAAVWSLWPSQVLDLLTWPAWPADVDRRSTGQSLWVKQTPVEKVLRSILNPENYKKMCNLVKFTEYYLFIRKLCMAYQNDQKHVIYIMVFTSCMFK